MRVKLIIICVLLLLLITGCGKKQMISSDNENSKVVAKNILIAYFTFPETDGVDESSSASRAILDNKVIGSTEYIAKIIQENTLGELFSISTVENYSGTHDLLVEQASKEKEENARPILKGEIKNFSNYDTVFIGCPNWWGDMPMSLYSFLEKYDFSRKTIIPFNTHGGSGFSNTIETMKELEPLSVMKERNINF